MGIKVTQENGIITMSFWTVTSWQKLESSNKPAYLEPIRILIEIHCRNL
jgi:hypothetical protein